MISDIEIEEDFIRETERFISKFEMYSFSKEYPYSKPFINLKEYFYKSIENNSYLYLDLNYIYNLLESIEYAYINLDKGNDFLYSSLSNHLTILLKTDYQSLESDNEEEDD